MTDQTQTTTYKLVCGHCDRTNVVPAETVAIIRADQPLAIGLDRARLIKAMRENITIGDIGSCSISLDGFEEAADAILALAAPADCWQGIETHDGSSDHVLIAEGGGSVCEARLLDDGRGWWERNVDPTDAWGYECNPTHWMPLPAAPTGEAGA